MGLKIKKGRRISSKRKKRTKERLVKKLSKKERKTGKKEKKNMKITDLPPKNWPKNLVIESAPVKKKIEIEKKVPLLKTIPKDIKELHKHSDIILEIVDIRNPDLSMLNIKNSVLILKKADLISKTIRKKIVENLKQTKEVFFFPQEDTIKTELELFRLLEFLCEKKKEIIKISLFGYENTGKKTFLNEIREKADRVEPSFFFYKNLIFFELLGTPEDNRKKSIHILSGNGPYPKNVLSAAKKIIEIASCEKIMFHYNIPQFKTFKEFKKYRKEQGCVSPEETLVDDWRSGAIKH